eukprot:Opistho-1_new@16481
MIATVVGARMGHYFFYEYPLLLSDPVKFFISMIKPPYAGLASHGAVIGMLIAFYLYSKKRNVPYLYVTDRVVPTAALGGAFIRFGNLMNSEIVGKQTDERVIKYLAIYLKKKVVRLKKLTNYYFMP